MVRADLHVHSKASKRPSEWFLKKVGARESYTNIDILYEKAKALTMDFVTITDHNTIEGGLELVQKYPEDTFLSVETTSYFPENKCKIHILLFDITPDEFAGIESVRHNIYKLRDYIKENDLAYSVAHGFYSVNKCLTLEILEKLILLFDVFEGLNGARNRYYNEIWQSVLESLTPLQVQNLAAKYKINPMSHDPWIKGFTGGSDDHACLFIGQTATKSDCLVSKKEFIQSIKDRKTRCVGRCNDYTSFAFSIYKIFCDFSLDAGKNTAGGIHAFINHVVFEDRQSRLKRWVTLQKVKKGNQIKDKIILKFFEDVYNWSRHENTDMETKMKSLYNSMGLMLDAFFKLLLESFVNDFAKGDIGRLFRNLMSSFPAFFISIPFFSSLRHLSQDRDIIFELKEKYNGKESIKSKKILWFTDTLDDLNGVSITLGKFRQESIKRNLNITFAACVKKENQKHGERNIMYLPWIYSITPNFYTSYTLNFPSLLSSMEMIYQYRPDRIIISTPGPVGILGMTMAGLLGIEAVSIYHTDFAAQAEYIFEDATLSGMIQFFINRFYAFSNKIKVPTNEYIRILEHQDYNLDKMSVFKRGITIHPFVLTSSREKTFKEQKGIKKGTTLLWAGRVSKDKNIEFLLDIYIAALKKIPQLNLVLCGIGPELEKYKKTYRAHERIYFMGYVENNELQKYYEMADLFVFPSTTDTFGMVILEAQAKGVFALVTDVGGPQEIIEDGKTGHVLGLTDRGQWVKKIEEIHELKQDNPEGFALLKAKCQNRVRQNYDWDKALDDILGEEPEDAVLSLPALEKSLEKDLAKIVA